MLLKQIIPIYIVFKKYPKSEQETFKTRKINHTLKISNPKLKYTQ